MFESRRRDPRPVYLVSAGGLPNYGDEILTRVWLDWLAQNRPDTPVWLDCPEPGRANHLFADAHPLLRTTNTLWHLAFGARDLDLAEGTDRATRFVTDLGSPRLDLGLLQLREVRSIHLIGGGYLNSVWENHLLILPALVALKQHYGVPLYATGQGLMPLSAGAASSVREWVSKFDIFEARDQPSAAVSAGLAGIDDAFLAFANPRDLYARDAPDVMVLLQGDFVHREDESALLDTAEQFIRAQGSGVRVGLVEGIAPDDSWALAPLRERGIDIEFYPFSRLWLEGLPARPGQRWLSTRFHFHLLAAAAGARGVAVGVSPEYYGVKHGSLREVGTGWTVAPNLAAAGGLTPTVNAEFPAATKKLAERKVSIAKRIYPRGQGNRARRQ